MQLDFILCCGRWRAQRWGIVVEETHRSWWVIGGDIANAIWGIWVYVIGNHVGVVCAAVWTTHLVPWVFCASVLVVDVNGCANVRRHFHVANETFRVHMHKKNTYTAVAVLRSRESACCVSGDGALMLIRPNPKPVCSERNLQSLVNRNAQNVQEHTFSRTNCHQDHLPHAFASTESRCSLFFANFEELLSIVSCWRTRFEHFRELECNGKIPSRQKGNLNWHVGNLFRIQEFCKFKQK